jgi:hypothetical protein
MVLDPGPERRSTGKFVIGLHFDNGAVVSRKRRRAADVLQRVPPEELALQRAFLDRVFAKVMASANDLTGVGAPSRTKRRREPASKHDYDWAAWGSAQVTGAVMSVALEMVVEEMRRDPPDPQTLADAADLLEEILDDMAKVSDPKQQRRECRRFIAALVQDDVDRVAARLAGRVPNPVEQALQTVALERGVKASKADAFTENPEGKTLGKWLQRNH